MLLSTRRMRWAAVALLLASGLLLIQPTRVWLQHIWIVGVLGPQVSIGEVIYHQRNSILEIRNLRWQSTRAPESRAESSATPASNSFSINAVRCWLGLDRPSLVDGRIYFPKVVLQDTVVTLPRNFPQPNAHLDSWQSAVADHLVQFEWENLRKRINCLSASEDVETKWSQRTHGVIERSRDIAIEGERLEAEAAAMDNPLRFEDSIRARLTRYRELSAEQRLLLSQLTDIESDLADDAERLEELRAQDVRALEQLENQPNAISATVGQARTLDSRLAIAIAEATWEQLAPYGEVVEGTCHAVASLRAADHDVTVRAGIEGIDHVRCADLKASGEFRFSHSSSPFQTSGSWRVAQQRPGDVFHELHFLTSFDCPSSTLEVTAAHNSRKAPGVQLRIRMLSQIAAQRKLPKVSAGPATLNALAPVTANLTCDSGSLTGTLRVACEALPLLSHKLPQDVFIGLRESLSESADESNWEPLQFELSGTWQQPELNFSSVVPAWLQRAVEQMLERQSQQLVAVAHQKLDAEFSQRAKEMRERNAQSAREALAIVAHDESTLLTRQQRLQLRIDEMSGTEFARRAGELQR